MTFQPVIPFSGLAGWAFLQRTRAAQQSSHQASPVLARDTAYFAEKIGKISSAGDLVGDYRLLKVALGAFGLDADLPNKAFIRQVLEGGSIASDSLANRMVDKRYLALTKAFGFDLGTPRTKLTDFPDEILSAYRGRQFEIAVGEQDNNLRMAMSLPRDLGAIARTENSADGRWFAVMGNEPVRKVFETALGLPPSLALLDIDRQLTVFRDRAKAVFGNGEVSQFANPGRVEELNRLFLVRTQITNGNNIMSPGAIALTLLRPS